MEGAIVCAVLNYNALVRGLSSETLNDDRYVRRLRVSGDSHHC
jgi:hypothetical protein